MIFIVHVVQCGYSGCLVVCVLWSCISIFGSWLSNTNWAVDVEQKILALIVTRAHHTHTLKYINGRKNLSYIIFLFSYNWETILWIYDSLIVLAFNKMNFQFYPPKLNDYVTEITLVVLLWVNYIFTFPFSWDVWVDMGTVCVTNLPGPGKSMSCLHVPIPTLEYAFNTEY